MPLASFTTQPFVCGGEAIRSAGPRGPCAGAAVLIPFDAARVPDSVHQEAMWPNCVARVHAGPRTSWKKRKRGHVVAWRGPRGSTQLFASPSGSDVAQLCGAGPRGSEKKRERGV